MWHSQNDVLCRSLEWSESWWRKNLRKLVWAKEFPDWSSSSNCMHLFAPSNGLSVIVGWKDPSNWCVSRLGITTRPKNQMLGGCLMAWRSQLFLSRGGWTCDRWLGFRIPRCTFEIKVTIYYCKSVCFSLKRWMGDRWLGGPRWKGEAARNKLGAVGPVPGFLHSKSHHIKPDKWAKTRSLNFLLCLFL